MGSRKLAFMEVIRSGHHESEIMPLDERLAIMKTMDIIRKRWGISYSADQ